MEVFWIKMPEDFDKLMKLTASELKIYILILDAIQKGDPPGVISESHLVKRIGSKRPATAAEAIKRLCELKLIMATKKGGATTTYALPYEFRKGKNPSANHYARAEQSTDGGVTPERNSDCYATAEPPMADSYAPADGNHYAEPEGDYYAIAEPNLIEKHQRLESVEATATSEDQVDIHPEVAAAKLQALRVLLTREAWGGAPDDELLDRIAAALGPTPISLFEAEVRRAVMRQGIRNIRGPAYFEPIAASTRQKWELTQKAPKKPAASKDDAIFEDLRRIAQDPSAHPDDRELARQGLGLTAGGA